MYGARKILVSEMVYSGKLEPRMNWKEYPREERNKKPSFREGVTPVGVAPRFYEYAHPRYSRENVDNNANYNFPAMTSHPIRVSSDPKQMDISAVHAYLSRSYWAANIPYETVARAIANSLCFGVFDGQRQVGFARVVTDKTTFAYLCDVYVLEEYRGRGLSRRLMETVCAHPDLQGLRRFALDTRDAHGLYEKFGFKLPDNPNAHMEIVWRDIYKQVKS